jgi:hypothetical protein
MQVAETFVALPFVDAHNDDVRLTGICSNVENNFSIRSQLFCTF